MLRLPVLAGGPLVLVALLSLLLSTALLGTAELAAETLQPADAGELERLITEAREQGAAVVVIQAPDPAALAAGARSGRGLLARSEARALEALARFEVVLGKAGDFPARIAETIRGYEPDLGMTWPFIIVLYAVGFLAIGYGAEWLFHRWARPYFSYLFNPTPATRAEKISYLLFRGAAQTVGLALQVAIALLLVFAFEGARDHHRNTAVVIILAFGSVRALSIFFSNLLAPSAPGHRLLALSDGDARRFCRLLTVLLGIIAVAGGLCLWMGLLGLDENAHLLGLIAATVLSTLLVVAFAIRQRRTVAGMILGAGPAEQKSRSLRFMAASWHIFAVVYFVAAWCVTATRLMLGLPNALGLVTGPSLVYHRTDSALSKVVPSH